MTYHQQIIGHTLLLLTMHTYEKETALKSAEMLLFIVHTFEENDFE